MLKSQKNSIIPFALSTSQKILPKNRSSYKTNFYKLCNLVVLLFFLQQFKSLITRTNTDTDTQYNFSGNPFIPKNFLQQVQFSALGLSDNRQHLCQPTFNN